VLIQIIWLPFQHTTVHNYGKSNKCSGRRPGPEEEEKITVRRGRRRTKHR